jgi:alpha-ribazole phosphatase
MLVHLLRHGETEGGARYWGATDVALSPKGWQQMREAVAGCSWDVIVSSPLRRCAAFAEVFARQLGVCCRYEADLREMNFGDWDGCSAGDVMQTDAERLRLFWADPSANSPPGGESLAQLLARVTAAWQRIVSTLEGERVLIVTHGGPIRLLRAAQSRTALSALLSIDVPHAALTSIECLTDGSAASNPGAPCLSLSTQPR